MPFLDTQLTASTIVTSVEWTSRAMCLASLRLSPKGKRSIATTHF